MEHCLISAFTQSKCNGILLAGKFKTTTHYLITDTRRLLVGLHRKYDDGIAPNVGQDSGKNLSGQNNNVGLPVSNLEVIGFVLVKVYSLDSEWKNFLAQIIDGPDKDGEILKQCF